MIFVRVGIGIIFLALILEKLIKVIVSHRDHDRIIETILKTAFYIVAIIIAIAGIVHIIQYQG